MKYILILFCSLVAGTAFSQTPATLPPELKDIAWNRYKTESFTILSIDDDQGKWLSVNLEKIKMWNLGRWGFPDVKFSKECRVVCVPNKILLKKLFNINESKVEIRKEVNVLWLVLDENPMKNIPSYLTMVCASELENNGYYLGWWAKRGMSMLNTSLKEIKDDITFLNDTLVKKTAVFSSEKLFTLKEEDYWKQDLETRRIFDTQSMFLCLMLRKEFGEAKLHKAFKSENPEEAIKVIYGFRNYKHFDSSFVRFMTDLANERLNNKIPDSYLTIKNKKD